MKIADLNQTQIMQKRSQKTSFKANINYVRPDTFHAMLATFPRSFRVWNHGLCEWTIDQSAVRKPVAFTEGVCNCVTGSIINPETKLLNMFHLSPYESNLSNLKEIKEGLIEQAIILKNGRKKPLEGLLLGGDSPQMKEGEEAGLLKTVLEAFEYISKYFGMDYSVIAGRKNKFSHLNLLSDARNGIHYVNVNSSNSVVNNATDLSRYYEIKLLSDKDNLFIRNKNATDKFRKLIEEDSKEYFG